MGNYREVEVTETPAARAARLSKTAENVAPINEEIGVDARLIQERGGADPEERADESATQAMRGPTRGKGGRSRTGRHPKQKRGTWTCPACHVEYCTHRPVDAGRPSIYDEPMAPNPFKPRIFKTEAEYFRSSVDVTLLLRDVVNIMRAYFERNGIDPIKELRERALEHYRGGGPATIDVEMRVEIAERWPKALLEWWRSTRTAIGVNDAVLCRELVADFSWLALTDPAVSERALRALEDAAEKLRRITA